METEFVSPLMKAEADSGIYICRDRSFRAGAYGVGWLIGFAGESVTKLEFFIEIAGSLQKECFYKS